MTMATIEAQQVTLVMELSWTEAADLADAIHEAASSVPDGNWRSNPATLIQLHDKLRDITGSPL
jgi:hypothetical protein